MLEFIRFAKFFYGLTGNAVFMLIAVMLGAGLFEIVGVSMFFPILEGENLEDPVVKLIHTVFNFFTIECTMINLLCVMVVLFFIRTIFMVSQSIYVAKFTAALLVNLRVKTINRLFESNYLLFLSKDSGFISNALMIEFNKITTALHMFLTVIMGIIFSCFYMVLPIFIAPKLVLFVICCGGIGGLAVIKINSYTRNYSVLTSKHSAKLQTLIIQSIQNFKYLKSTFSYPNLTEKIDYESRRLGNLSVKMAFLQVVMSDGFIPFVFLMIACLIYYQVEIVGIGLNKTLFVLVLIYQSVTKSINIQANYRKLLANVGSINVYQEFDSELVSNKERFVHDGEPVDLNKPITFENVSFRYPGGNNILEDINIKIPPRSTVAFVGMSGAGKSTLLTLLTGVLSPSNGDIFLGDISYKEINQKSLRRSIGYVTQESVIFNDSIENNITFWNGKMGQRKKNVEVAAQKAYISSFIDTLPEKYDSLLGENGIMVSGGQRQRISIARELYKSVDMIIFDEATSSLDSASEREIQKNIEGLKGQCTIVLVSHRLSTIIKSDIIFVLKDGRIVEQGSYETLCRQNGEFNRMVRTQSMNSIKEN